MLEFTLQGKSQKMYNPVLEDHSYYKEHLRKLLQGTLQMNFFRKIWTLNINGIQLGLVIIYNTREINCPETRLPRLRWFPNCMAKTQLHKQTYKGCLPTGYQRHPPKPRAPMLPGKDNMHFKRAYFDLPWFSQQ